MRRLYRLSVNLNRCRCRKVLRQLSRKVSRKWSLTDIGVEEQSIRFKNISSIYPLAVEKLSRRQELSRSIHQVSRSCRDCDMKKLKELDRQQGIEKVSSQLLKAVFQEEKNTNMNAIKYATQPMIQITYKYLKSNS